MSEPKETTKVVREGLEKLCKEFTIRISPLRFKRTKKMFWTRRNALTVDFIYFHRHGSTYGAPINYSVRIRVHFGIRVLNDSFPAEALNGPFSDPGKIHSGRYHLCFNAKSGSTYDQCLEVLLRFVLTEGSPWFEEFQSAAALLERPDSPLRPADKELLRDAVAGNTNEMNLAASLKMLGIKP